MLQWCCFLTPLKILQDLRYCVTVIIFLDKDVYTALGRVTKNQPLFCQSYWVKKITNFFSL